MRFKLQIIEADKLLFLSEYSLELSSHLLLTVTLMLTTLTHAQILFIAFLPKHSHRLASSPLKLNVTLNIKSKSIINLLFNFKVNFSLFNNEETKSLIIIPIYYM